MYTSGTSFCEVYMYIFVCLVSCALMYHVVSAFSFVRSITMDRWKDSEVEKMKVGGNKRAHEFFSSQSDITDGMTISEKYNSKAAALYRDKVSWPCARGVVTMK